MPDLIEPLITKYRPLKFEEVVGNEVVINSLMEAMGSNSTPKAYLLTGPPGLGKTTLARIIADTVNATVTEFDVASHAGVDEVRELVEMSNFQPVVAGGSRMYILDECHVYSKTAWQALLKLLEEPPPYLYIALCTSEVSKVPESIRRRCFSVPLNRLKAAEMDDYLSMIAEIEDYKVQPDVLSAIVQAANGSPGMGLTLLQAGHMMMTRDDLQKIINEVEAPSTALTELCSYLIRGGSDWGIIQTRMNELAEDDNAFEGITRYMYSAMVKSKDGEQAKRAWMLLDAFTYPRQSLDRKALLGAVIGAILWS